MPSRTAKARIRAKAGSGTRRGDGIPGGWPVVAGIPRRCILRPQRHPDAREALDRPMAVRLAQRMLAVPVRFDFDESRTAAEQDDQDDDRHEDRQGEKQAEGRAGGDRPSRAARGPRVPGRRSGLADPERLEHPGPREQEDDDQGEPDRRGDDLPPRERFHRCLLTDPPTEKCMDEDRDDETREDDEQQVSQERVEDAEGAWLGAALGAPSRNRLPPGVEVRDVEGERRDEDDRKEQEQRDRPLGLSPPRADHACAKAPCAHNGFPDSRGSQEAYATPSCSKNCARRRWPINCKARATRPEAIEKAKARTPTRTGPPSVLRSMAGAEAL